MAEPASVSRIYEKLEKKLEDALRDEGKKRARFKVLNIIGERHKALSKIVCADELSRKCREIKKYAISNLETLCTQAIENLKANGCEVYVAKNTEEAVEYVIRHLKSGDVVVKTKTNVGREIGIAKKLSEIGIKVVETDLGDRIVQLANGEPSHLLMPSMHFSRGEVARLLSEETGKTVYPEISEIVGIGKSTLRKWILQANAGLTGANAIAAYEGAISLVENEGNQRLSTSMPDIHIVVTGIDKIVSTEEDAVTLLKGEAYFGVGQISGNYISFITGPSRSADIEGDIVLGAQGPIKVVVVLIDNGRRMALAEGFEECLYCLNCGGCLNYCPVYKQIGEKFGDKYFGGRGVVFTAFHESPDKSVEAGLFYCTECGECKNFCPTKIDTPGIVEKLRIKAVKDGYILPPHNKNVKSILEYGNPYSEANENRSNWFEKNPAKEKTDLLFFVGCTSSYRTMETAKSSLKVLEALGISFTYLKEKEKCCGSLLLRTGHEEIFQTLVEENVQMFKQARAGKIFTVCAGCYRTLKNDYPKYSRDFNLEVLHITELINEKIDKDRFFLKDVKATYHDPCHLGRHAGIYDPPREILNKLSGVKLVEMENVRDRARCCGSGGGVRAAFPKLSSKIAEDRLLEAMRTGAEVFTSACPFCKLNIQNTAEILGLKIKVGDIIDLLAEALSRSVAHSH